MPSRSQELFIFLLQNCKFKALSFMVARHYSISRIFAMFQRDREERGERAEVKVQGDKLYSLSLLQVFTKVYSYTLISWYVFISQSVSSVTQSCPTLCYPMNRSTPGLPVHHQLPEFTQTHVHRVGDAIQPSHPLLSPSPPAPNPPQHQSLFQ